MFWIFVQGGGFQAHHQQHQHQHHHYQHHQQPHMNGRQGGPRNPATSPKPQPKVLVDSLEVYDLGIQYSPYIVPGCFLSPDVYIRYLYDWSVWWDILPYKTENTRRDCMVWVYENDHVSYADQIPYILTRCLNIFNVPSKFVLYCHTAPDRSHSKAHSGEAQGLSATSFLAGSYGCFNQREVWQKHRVAWVWYYKNRLKPFRGNVQYFPFSIFTWIRR